MDAIPSNFMCKPDTMLSSDPEIAPPIPPKRIEFDEEWDHHGDSGKAHYGAPNDLMSAEIEIKEDELPPLPPKPK